MQIVIDWAQGLGGRATKSATAEIRSGSADALGFPEVFNAQICLADGTIVPVEIDAFPGLKLMLQLEFTLMCRLALG